MKYYIIKTPYGNYYIANEDGYITQYEGSDREYSFSHQWQVQGISHVKKNLFISWSDLVERIDMGGVMNWLYKTSGNPQYTIRDLDHGTTREWGNTKFHGIEKIYYLLDSDNIKEA